MTTNKSKLISMVIVCAMLLVAGAAGANMAQAFEPLKGDLASFDPHNQKFPPVSDDVIKIGIFWAFSGPGAITGNIFWATIGLAVHDINSQGGVMVNGKKMKILLIKGDNQMKPTVAKRAMEKLCVEDDVDFIIGTTGSHLNLIGQQVAAKYKKIYLNVASVSDSLMDAKNFNRYTFRNCSTVSMLAIALAKFYAKRPETKFYILCQDYSYGHVFAKTFKDTIKTSRPDAQIVGEDYHPMFVKDFAPYLTKVKASGAEVIITGDYTPDSDNMIKQADQLGMNVPMAGPYIDNAIPLQSIKPPHGKGFVPVHSYMTVMDNPGNLEFMNKWHESWKNWKAPLYNGPLFKWPTGILPQSTISTYWMLKVVEKAGSLDPEKIIAAWEGDEIELFGNKYKMRACDHQGLFDMHASELSWPNDFFKKAAAAVNVMSIPVSECAQPIPEGLSRCK